MSEFNFDDLEGLLEKVMAGEEVEASDAPVLTPPAPEPVVEPVPVATVPDSDDILGEFMDDLVEPEATVITAPEVDSVEDMLEDLMGDEVEPEVTQCVSPEDHVEEPAENAETPTQPETAEHVFADPVDQGKAVTCPTFTTDEIADSLDIRNFATLVTLNTARWHAKVKDRKAAKDAADASGAKADAFEARKKLLAGCDSKLKQVHKAIDAARTEHYRLTMPWSMVGVNDVGKRTGGRLMPNTLFMEYTTAMAKAKAEMDRLVVAFEKDYPSLLAIAKQNLGSAFDPAQYPNPSSIAQHFRLSFDFNPIPVGTDFKGLQDAQVQKLGAALNKKTRTMLENAMQDAWVQLHDSVQLAYDRLSQPKQMFHATLIKKLCDQASILTHLNATKDPRIEAVRKMVEDKLTKHDAKDIRKDEALRKHLAEQASDILKHMEEAANA